MRYLDTYGAWLIGGAGSIYAFITGNYGDAAIILMAIMLIDVVSGWLKGFQNKNLRSDKMSFGLLKKGGILLAIVFAGLVDKLVSNGEPIFASMMIWLSIGNEGMSIVENLAILGVDFPEQLTARLGQLRERKENKADHDDFQE